MGRTTISDPSGTKRDLYPSLEAHTREHLDVGQGHRIYWERSGNPKGQSVVFLHGGPGGGSDAKHRRFFDPEAYDIIVFDQRGCGRSTPHASLENNTTWDLVADIERLREHLAIESWQLFGGSWGSTLALAYAQTHPTRVSAMVLRGIFTFADDEMQWFYGGGTAALFPEAWHDFVAGADAARRDDLLAAYHEVLTGEDEAARLAAAKAWSLYECRVAGLLPDPGITAHCEDPHFVLAFARIEAHYFANGGFLRSPTQLFDDLHKIDHIPTRIVHGRYDVICPLRNAWRLHQRLSDAELFIASDAGHSAFEPGIVDGLVRATDGLR